jgi:hypothetical protein
LGGSTKTACRRNGSEDHQATDQPTVNFVHDASQSSKR